MVGNQESAGIHPYCRSSATSERYKTGRQIDIAKITNKQVQRICEFILLLVFCEYTYPACLNISLYLQMQRVVNAFSRGLSDIISLSWLTLFNAQELNQVNVFLFVREASGNYLIIYSHHNLYGVMILLA